MVHSGTKEIMLKGKELHLTFFFFLNRTVLKQYKLFGAGNLDFITKVYAFWYIY